MAACTIFPHRCNNAMLSCLLPSPSDFFFLLRGEFCLFSFICWSSSTTPLKPETPGYSHLPNSLRTRLITHQLCVVVLSVLFFYYCLVFCTALCPFTYNIVILWLCKWQLTGWVGVNTAVYNVAIGKEEKQVINNNNNYIQYEKCNHIIIASCTS